MIMRGRNKTENISTDLGKESVLLKLVTWGLLLFCGFIFNILIIKIIVELDNRLAFDQQKVKIIYLFFWQIVFIGTSLMYLLYVDKNLFLEIKKGSLLNNKHFVIVFWLTICNLVLGFLLIVGMKLAINSFFSDAIKAWFYQQELDVFATKKLDTFGNLTGFFWGGIVTKSILPAINEDLIFRGILQNTVFLKTKNRWFSIIFTSILFSISHLTPFYIIPFFIGGMVIGYVYYITKNLFLAIFFHFLHNTIVESLQYFNKNETFIADSQEALLSLSFLQIIGGIVISFLIIYISCRSLIKRHKPST